MATQFKDIPRSTLVTIRQDSYSSWVWKSTTVQLLGDEKTSPYGSAVYNGHAKVQFLFKKA